MRECLHVFRKDVRRFWPYILALLAIRVADLYLFPDRWVHLERRFTSALIGLPAVFLPPLVGFFLMGAVIHEDGPCGDDRFWLTRPHRPLHLLAAKILFALVFLNLPYFISDLVWAGEAGVLSSAAFEMAAWRQLMLMGLFVLVPAAAAAVTRTVVQYVSCCAGALLVAAFVPDLAAGLQKVWGPLVWQREQAVLAVFSIAAGVALVWQYRRRESTVGRGILAAGFTAVLAIEAFAPYGVAHAVQTRLTGTASEPVIRVAFDAGRDGSAREALARAHGESVALEIPVKLSGVKQPERAFVDALNLCVEPDGAAPECTGWSARYNVHGWPAGEWARFTVEPGFYQRLSSRPARVRVLAALTLFTDQERVELKPGTLEWHLNGGTACTLDSKRVLNCRSLDSSARLAIETPGSTARFSLLPHFSYGRVAYDLHILPYPLRRQSSAYRLQSGDALIAQRPAAHFVRQFETRVTGLQAFAVLEKK